MFHPVGSKPPTVYWRRRLSLVGAVIAVLVLVVLTAKAFAGGNDKPLAGASTTSAHSPSTPITSSDPRPSSTSTTHDETSGTSTAVPSACDLAKLKVVAVVGKTSYPVGAQPVVELQVTNAGPAPCVQNLADSQIELRVYNGSSRVWGSHDCAIQPGTKSRTLAVGRAYLSAVLWGGLSSEPGCKGTRQRIGAGQYTLYALLSGKQGTPAQFSIS
jgi:hypothetical protein